MSNKKTLVSQVLLATGILFFAIASHAASEYEGHPGSTAVTKLLQSGYEVKAAYEANTGGDGHHSQIIILQKVGSVYQCSTYNVGKPEYINTYSCVQIQDAD